MRVPVPAISPHDNNSEIISLRESRAHDQEMQQLAELIGKLAVDANKNGLLIFAGAGISVPLPSGCPTWAGFRKEILGCFLDRLIQEDWPKKPYLIQAKPSVIDMDLRPETFMWALEQDIGLSRTLDIIGGINRSSPNQNHETLAYLCQIGVVKAVVTTNLDTYIERALDKRGIKYTLIRDTNETALVRDSKKARLLVYKPHGCLSKPSSMEYRIDQIQSLPREKRELLSDLLKSFTVLVIGYSGNDEDIFPVMCEALAKNKNGSYICVFPESPRNEPIQQWDITAMPNVKRFYADPLVVLSSVRALLDRTKDAVSYHTLTPQSSEKPSWREHLSSQVEKIGHDIIAVTISHLCHLHGHHSRALSFANLAQDICEDTNLSSRPRETLMFIKEMQARIYKELGQQQIAENLQGARFREALEGVDYHEVIDALLGRAHAALRNNNLQSAERDLNLVGVHLMRMGKVEPEKASADHMAYLWYSGILKRKQGKAKDADTLFNQAVTIAHAHQDVIHGARILLDYGYVKCQLDDWESAQQIWGFAVHLAEQANDWDAAAKAAKNRGILLSVSDNPQLGRPELERAKSLFERAGNHEGRRRAEEALKYTQQELMLAVLSLGRLGAELAES